MWYLKYSRTFWSFLGINFEKYVTCSKIIFFLFEVVDVITSTHERRTKREHILTAERQTINITNGKVQLPGGQRDVTMAYDF